MELNLKDEVILTPNHSNENGFSGNVNTRIPNKLSYRKWRNEIKKQKRKAKRRELAQLRDVSLQVDSDHNLTGNETSDEEKDRRRVEHELWLERERDAQIKFLAKKDREEKERLFREEEQRKIKEAWAEEQKKRRSEEDIQKKNDSRKLKEDINQLQHKKNDNWQNPPAPPGYNAEHQEVKNCPFFQKVGACRFGINCKRAHDVPETSSTLLFPGMFANFELEQSFRDEFDSDLTLEYEEGDLYEEFKLFYEDVLPEFETIGHVTRFVVCCNYEPHLRGNVYVQFASKKEAMSAFEKFNGRWYCKRQLSCQFTAVDNWKSAICGLFHHKKCPKGKNCNFLHVFQNPAPLRHGTKSSCHSRERPENSLQHKYAIRRSHHKSSSRSFKMDSDSSPDQLTSKSHKKYRAKSSAANDSSRVRDKYYRTSHNSHSRSRSRYHQSSYRTHRSKSRSLSKHFRRSISKSPTSNRSRSSPDSPTASEQCHESRSPEKSLSKSSKLSHKEHRSSKSPSKSCQKHRSSSHLYKKHKLSKSRKHHHHSKDDISTPKHHLQNASKKSRTDVHVDHLPSKSIHSESDSDLKEAVEYKSVYSRRKKDIENLSTDSDAESIDLRSKVGDSLDQPEVSVKGFKVLQLHQEGVQMEEEYGYENEITKKRKKTN